MFDLNSEKSLSVSWNAGLNKMVSDRDTLLYVDLRLKLMKR